MVLLEKLWLISALSMITVGRDNRAGLMGTCPTLKMEYKKEKSASMTEAAAVNHGLRLTSAIVEVSSFTNYLRQKLVLRLTVEMVSNQMRKVLKNNRPSYVTLEKLLPIFKFFVISVRTCSCVICSTQM